MSEQNTLVFNLDSGGDVVESNLHLVAAEALAGDGEEFDAEGHQVIVSSSLRPVSSFSISGIRP